MKRIAPMPCNARKLGFYSAAALFAAVLPLCGGCNQSTAEEAPVEFTAKQVLSADALHQELDEVIAFVESERLMSSNVNAAWQILHGVLAYGPDLEIEHEEKRVAALEFAMQGGPMTGWVMRPGDVGLRAVVEPGTKTGQGHEDQWLAIIAQCGLPSEAEIVVAGQTYTVGDLLKQAMWDTYEGKEASWTLSALCHYLPIDATWTARDGGEWSFEKLIAMEAAEDIPTSACGGTHRLSAMNAAIGRYRTAHPDAALTGAWLAAQRKIDDAIETARNWQQPSGALSANLLLRPGTSLDPTTNLYATGHVFEFLAGAVDESELSKPWMAKAAEYLCELLRRTRQLDLECGSLYHAVHGLIVYRDRRFGSPASAD